MTVAIIVLVAIALLLGLTLVLLYNKLVRLRNRVENAWAQVDVQLRRRYDLIPNLVETVKGYASHERATFDEVTEARTAAQRASTVEDQARAENMLTRRPREALRRRRGLPRAARDGELPAAADPARRDGRKDRDLSTGLQRRRPHVRHRARDRADEHRRGHVQLRREAVLRDRGAGSGGTASPLLRR